MKNWKKTWNDSEWIRRRTENYNIVNKFLKDTNKSNLLDIGCGFAIESSILSKEYNTHIYLLDGDTTTNNKTQKRHNDFGKTETMQFYNKLEDIEEKVKKITTNYTIIDCNNIKLDDKLKFDIIWSFRSCGFHYPLSTYRKLCLKHSHKNTKFIFDIRKGTIPKDINIEKILYEDKKKITAVIKFI